MSLGPYKKIIEVHMIQRGWQDYGGWYYCGSCPELDIPHVNTTLTHAPFTTAEDAKAAAVEYVRSYVKEGTMKGNANA